MNLNNAQIALELLNKKDSLEKLLHAIRNNKNYKLKIVEPFTYIRGECTIYTIEDCSIIEFYFEEQLKKINEQLIDM